MRRIFAILGLSILLIVLTMLTQVGGIAVMAGMAIGQSPVVRGLGPLHRRGVLVLAPLLIYGMMTAFLAPPLAASLGRVRLPCSTGGDGPVVVATWLTCALNRGYVRPELRDLVLTLGTEMGRRFPGSRVTTLEGNFPFIDGFPLFPHLSHRDGGKLDLAFFYRRTSDDAPIPNGSPSWLGYFIYEQPKREEPQPCVGQSSARRWDLDGFQPRPPAWRLDEPRTAWMLAWLKSQPRVSRLFIEPHLAERMGVAGGKVRFQGCGAARHDDHIHIEVR